MYTSLLNASRRLFTSGKPPVNSKLRRFPSPFPAFLEESYPFLDFKSSLVVGGFVRDMLLSMPFSDIDLLTTAKPAAIVRGIHGNRELVKSVVRRSKIAIIESVRGGTDVLKLQVLQF